MNIYYTFMQNILHIIHARVVWAGRLAAQVMADCGPVPGKKGRRGIKGWLISGRAAPATTCPGEKGRKEKGRVCRPNKIDYVDSHNG